MHFSRQYSRLFITLKDDASKASGRCVVELKNGRGRLNCVVQGINPNTVYKAMLIKSGDIESTAVPTGIIANNGSRGSLRFEFNPENISESNINIDDIDAVSVNNGSNVVLYGFVDKKVNFEGNMRIFSKTDNKTADENIENCEENKTDGEQTEETEESKPNGERTEETEESKANGEQTEETEESKANGEQAEETEEYSNPADELIDMIEKFKRNINELECFAQPKSNNKISFNDAVKRFCPRTYPFGKADDTRWYETDLHFWDYKTAHNPLVLLGYKKYGHILRGEKNTDVFIGIGSDRDNNIGAYKKCGGGFGYNIINYKDLR